MAQKLDPDLTQILLGGARGTLAAMVTGACLWLVASATGVSYAIEDAEEVSITGVLLSLAIAGLAATALALALHKTRRGTLFFGVLCIAGLALSLVTPLSLASEVSTRTTLVVHHLVGGSLIAIPLAMRLSGRKRHVPD